jgi:hypothetical protein
MAKEQELLDMIEDESPEMEEVVVTPVDFDPVKKVAAVMEKNTPREDLLGLDAGTLDQRLVAAFLLENLRAGTVQSELQGRDGDKALKRLVLVDAAYEFTNKSRYQENTTAELAVTTAGDIYHNVFNTLCNLIYVQGQKARAKRTPEGRAEVTEGYQDAFHQFKPTEPTQLVAANRVVSLVDLYKPGLAFAQNSADVKYLVAIDTYAQLLKNPELVEDIGTRMMQTEHNFKDLYVYAVLKLHQDFFRQMEKL